MNVITAVLGGIAKPVIGLLDAKNKRKANLDVVRALRG